MGVMKEIQGEKDRRAEYACLVGDVCDESEDYGKVLDRLHYLERFRG